MNWLRAAAACVVALSLGACATVSSNYGNSRADQKGQAYYLPKGLIQVSVVESGGQFNVTVAGPIMVADTDYRFHADLRKAALSDNNALVAIDPATQLLTTAQVVSTGRAKEVVENVYRATSGYAAGWQGYAPVEIFSGLYEPDQLDRASADASAALTSYFIRNCGEDGQSPIDPGGYQDCERYRMLGIDQPGMVSISTDGPVGAATANDTIGKCGRGLCYRPLVPVKVRTVIAGTYVSEDYYMVPDTKTVSYFTLPSGMFATQEYNLTFDLGVLVQADQKQQSEVAGFVSLPADILERIIAAPVKAIRGRPKTSTVYTQRAYSGAGAFSGAPQAGQPLSYFNTKTISIGRSAAGGEAGYRASQYYPAPPAGAAQYPGANQGQASQQYSGSSYYEPSESSVVIEREVLPDGRVIERRITAPVSNANPIPPRR